MKLRLLFVSAVLIAATAAAATGVGLAAGSARAGHAASASAVVRASAAKTKYVWNLSAVSCSTADACEAVGTVGRESGFNPTTNFSFAEHWDGRRWTLQRIVNPSDEVFLNSISCGSDTDCIAVGEYERGSSSYLLAERWDGRAWSRLTPVPVTRDAGFGSLSCQSAWACTATAERMNAAQTRWIPVVERWDGVRWSIVATPYKSINHDGGWGPLTCPIAGECLVLGPNDEAVARLTGSDWL